MKRYLGILALSGALTVSASAATQITVGANPPVDAFVTGNPGPLLGGFSPGTGLGPDGTAAELQVLDTGVNGDAVADDGIFSVTVDNLTSNTALNWKIASNGFGPVNSPTTNDQYALVPASGEVTFYIQTTPFGDGFQPEVPNGTTAGGGYSWTDQHLAFFDAATTVSIVGSFQNEVDAGDSDFSPTGAGASVMTRSGNEFTGTITGLPAGSYELKIITDNDYAPADVSSEGLSNGGDNIGFASAGPTDVITVTLDAVTARHRVQNSASIPVGFYAQSADAAIGSGFDPGNLMTEVTTGVYSLTTTVAAVGDHVGRIRDENLNAFPSTGNFPYTTTAPNQQVTFIFDTNTYADGFQPNTNMALVIDTATQSGLTDFFQLQLGGTFRTQLGVPNFADDDPSFNMVDQGGGLWTWIAPFAAISSSATSEFKVFTLRNSGDPFFDVQLGGGNPDTITLNGNNPNATGPAINSGEIMSGLADTDWARIAMFSETGPVTVGTLLTRFPARPSYLGGASVDSWSAFD